jgi:hypothetical protein
MANQNGQRMASMFLRVDAFLASHGQRMAKHLANPWPEGWPA